MGALLIAILSACVLVPSPPGAGNNAIIRGETLVAPRGDIPAQQLAWSPAEPDQLLVLAYEEGLKPAEIYILDISTGTRRVLVADEPEHIPEIAWTSNGRHVLISVGHDGRRFQSTGWWELDINNGQAQHLSAPGFTPAKWSPDGDLLAESGAGDLIITTLATGTVQKIHTDVESLYLPGASWSGGGSRLAIPGGAPGAMDLYIVDVRNQSTRRITQGTPILDTAWSPAHDVIAYTTEWPVNGKTTLNLVTADGKCSVEIWGVSNAISPTWSPDGRRLAFIDLDGIHVVDVSILLGKGISSGICSTH